MHCLVVLGIDVQVTKEQSLQVDISFNIIQSKQRNMWMKENK